MTKHGLAESGDLGLVAAVELFEVTSMLKDAVQILLMKRTMIFL